MAYTPKRRRGPNKPKVQAGPDGETVPVIVAPVVEAQEVKSDAPPLTRRRKRADVGGHHLRLAAPTREGFQRRWGIDKPGRIAKLQDLAYDFVSEPGIQTDSPDSRIRRLSGTHEGGAPQYSYLMETPLSEYQAGIDEKEEGRRAFEDAIRRGADPLGNALTAKTDSHESYIR